MESQNQTEKDLYKLLNIPRSATQKDIKKAYKTLARQYHPDKNIDNPEKAKKIFQEIADAYEILSNSDKRSIYNKYGLSGLKQNNIIPKTKKDLDKIFDILCDSDDDKNDDLAYQNEPRCNSIDINLDISIKDAYFGCNKVINFERNTLCKNCQKGKMVKQIQCTNCNNTGIIKTQSKFSKKVKETCQCKLKSNNNNDMDWNDISWEANCQICQDKGFILKYHRVNCNKCNGKGYKYNNYGYKVNCYHCNKTGFIKNEAKKINCECQLQKIVNNIECEKCNNKGFIETIQWGFGTEIIERKCNKCQGLGYKEKTIKCNSCQGKFEYKIKDKLNIKLEKGVKQGKTIKLKNFGNEEINKLRGYVLIHINVKKDNIFELKGKNLFIKKELELYQALYKYNFILKHINGKQYNVVSSMEGDIIENNEIKCIKNMGMPLKNGGFGDLYIQFSVKLPKKGDINCDKLKRIYQLLKPEFCNDDNMNNINIETIKVITNKNNEFRPNMFDEMNDFNKNKSQTDKDEGCKQM